VRVDEVGAVAATPLGRPPGFDGTAVSEVHRAERPVRRKDVNVRLEVTVVFFGDDHAEGESPAALVVDESAGRFVVEAPGFFRVWYVKCLTAGKI